MLTLSQEIHRNRWDGPQGHPPHGIVSHHTQTDARPVLQHLIARVPVDESRVPLTVSAM